MTMESPMTIPPQRYHVTVGVTMEETSVADFDGDPLALDVPP